MPFFSKNKHRAELGPITFFVIYDQWSITIILQNHDLRSLTITIWKSHDRRSRSWSAIISPITINLDNLIFHIKRILILNLSKVTFIGTLITFADHFFDSFICKFFPPKKVFKGFSNWNWLGNWKIGGFW